MAEPEAFLPTPENFYALDFGGRLDMLSKKIMTRGYQRPFFMLFWHFCVWLVNYGTYALLACFLWKRDPSTTVLEHWRLLFAKFMVWQHLAEAIGCRQGPIGGRFGLPNNWRFRLSTGTMKLPFFKCLGVERNYFDLIVHAGFFLACFWFIFDFNYNYLAIRILCVLDVWILCSDMSQFYASTGHGYWTMLLSLCFSGSDGQLAGVQIALIFQWFFSGIGKIGPWFHYVNGPFMLQSRWLRGQRWLFKLLVKGEDNLSPTKMGIVAAEIAAAVEYLAPIAIMTLNYQLIWAGIIGITAMHVYILTMPAPFDVYSWNTCYMCSGVYLFYLNASSVAPDSWSTTADMPFGFDWQGAKTMHPILAFCLFCEFAVCWYGQFYPNQVGYYLSHRYWAGNWVQGFYMVRRTDACFEKLNKVKTFEGNPLGYMKAPQEMKFLTDLGSMAALSYLWTATFNVKCIVRMMEEGMSLCGENNFDNWQFVYSLPSFASGEFRDQLYSRDMMKPLQDVIGFDDGECFMIQFGSFGCCRQTAFYRVTDLKKGVIKEGNLSREGMQSMDAYPSKSRDMSLKLAPGEDDLAKPFLGA